MSFKNKTNVKMSSGTRAIYRFNATPLKIVMALFKQLEQIILNFV